MSRAHRKNEHLFYSLKRKPGKADFKDVSFVHNCIPDKALGQISLETEYMGRTYRSPLFINAITGGSHVAHKINAALADVARTCNIPMAVGSQMAALENSSCTESYSVVRRRNPGGFIWSNIGAYATPQMAARAVNMVRADALQIHLNTAQELVMKGGDRDFIGMLKRIEEIVKVMEVPVIAKEVGFGIAREQAEALQNAGVSAIDIGGKGGTNFIVIEGSRSDSQHIASLIKWGIPTAISLCETVDVLKPGVDLFASGGLSNALDLAKALSLGAKAVGLAAMPLYILVKYGRKALIRKIHDLENDLKKIILLTGAGSIADLQKVPLVVTGYTSEWLINRGIDPGKYARRSLTYEM
ncbi:MAG: type 2 isopentenyl-diphosphate Delta-isomerase [Bacillota bacterium]